MKKIIALLLVLAMLLSFAACGGNQPANNAENNTAVPDNTANAENNTNNVPVTPPEPPEPPKPKYTNPLSGEAMDEDISNNCPFGIMTNNIIYAIPQHGISQAELVFEMNAEGNITRFIAIYQNITKDSGRIGSIRSARPYYLDWALAFDCMYIHAGGSNTAYNQIRQRGINNINVLGANNYPKYFYRDEERKKAGYAIEHTMFTTGELLTQLKADRPEMRQTHKDGYKCSLTFTDTAQTAGGTAANSIDIKMNSNKHTIFDYDAATKQYFITEYGDPMIDGETKEKLSVKNVFVLFTKYWHEYSGSVTLLADMSGGKGVYACEGKLIEIEWKRTDDGGLKLYTADGKDLSLAVGHSFFCCADSASGGYEAK